MTDDIIELADQYGHYGYRMMLTVLFLLRGPPEYISSDNGAEFIAQKVREWIAAVGAKTVYI